MRLVREKRFHLPMDLVIQKDSNLHLVIRKRMRMCLGNNLQMRMCWETAKHLAMLMRLVIVRGKQILTHWRLAREKRLQKQKETLIQTRLHLVIRKRMPMHSVKVMQKAKAIWILMQKAKGSYWLKLMGFPMRMVKDWLKLMLTAKVIERHLHWVRVMQKEI